ncbi:MAG: ComEC/Rec2 family competence protein [Clostridiales bacterium]|nr:ComEC/Rec2 family competence protein [Clostridiales bacterium]
MEYICIAVILGIFGGIYNSPIFFIAIILSGILICILLKIFEKRLEYYNIDRKKLNKYILKSIIIMIIVILIMFLNVQNIERKINNIYEKDKKNDKGEYLVSVIDEKKGKNKTTYTVIFRNINGVEDIRINGKIYAKKKMELGKDYIIRGKLEKYNNERNYMGFNQRLYMYSRSNYFKIIEHNENIEKVEDGKLKSKMGLERVSIYNIYNDISKTILSNISKYRIKHREVLEKYVKNKYLLEGIIVGDIDNVDEEIKENFKDINSYHLLAISGSHMAYLMVIIEFLVKRLKYGKSGKNIIIILIIGMYIVLAGFSPAVLRAGISSIILSFFRIIRIRTNLKYYLSLSIIILFLIFPYMVTDVRNLSISRRGYSAL